MCELLNLFKMNDILDENEKLKFLSDAYALLPDSPDERIITQISATNYEKNECKDKNLVFIPSFVCDIDNIRNKVVDVRISSEICLIFKRNNIRLLRKMLEPIDKMHCLVLGQINKKDYQVIGIAKLAEIQKIYMCYMFTIKKHMTWYLNIGKTDVLGYKNGNYVKICDIKNDINIHQKISEITSRIANIDENCFEKLLSILMKKEQGTSFIIFSSTDKAKSEAERLASQNVGRGFLLQSGLKFEEDTIMQITNIDGGLIFDGEANCYAYGCIFDGKVPNNGKLFEGDSSRGSRYNSIKLYVETTGGCVGVIYSDDGTIDVISSI